MEATLHLLGGQKIGWDQRVPHDAAGEETGEGQLTRTAEWRAPGQAGERRECERARLERIRRASRGKRRRRHPANL